MTDAELIRAAVDGIANRLRLARFHASERRAGGLTQADMGVLVGDALERPPISQSACGDSADSSNHVSSP